MIFRLLATSIFDNGKVAFSLRWNWGNVLLFVLIWSYGFESVQFDNAPIKSLLITIFLVAAISIVNRVSNTYPKLYQEKYDFTNLDISVLSLYVILLVTLSISATYKFDISLVGDQLYHAQSSQNQSMGIADWLIHKFQIPATIEYKTIVRLVSCAMLGIVIFLVAHIRRYNLGDRTTLLILLLLLLRLGYHYSDIHPPFRLFPLWINSILFGINDFSFRLTTLLALSLLAFVIYKFSQKHFGSLNAFLVGLTVATIPLLLHVSSLVEQSVWSAISWIFILIAIRESFHSPNYVRWLSVVVIAALMRAPAFIALVPIFGLMIAEYLKKNEFKNIQPYLIAATPVLVLIPFLWIQLSQGSPATSGQLSPLHQIMSTFDNGFSVKVMYYNIQLPWVLFLPFCLLPIKGHWLKIQQLLCFLYLHILFSTPSVQYCGEYRVTRRNCGYPL